MKLYTKTGDKGKTALIGGRVEKDNLRVETYGTVDELNAFVGVAITELNDTYQDIIRDLTIIQHELFDCGGDLANVMKERQYKLTEASITYLEERIDMLAAETPPLQKFILPGGTKGASALHVARTVTRRAERQMVTLVREVEDVPLMIQIYLNRLSDYFFAAARVINYRANVSDVEYERGGQVFK